MTANEETFAQLPADMSAVPPVLTATVPDAPMPARDGQGRMPERPAR